MYICTSSTGAGNLIHMKAPSSFDECKEFDSGLLSSIRHHLSKNKYYNIEGLLTAFLHLDKVCMLDFILNAFSKIVEFLYSGHLGTREDCPGY